MLPMMIGQLAARTGLSVRTLRFYADAGVLHVSGRTEAGYRLFDADAVARARLVRTLRELGIGLADVKRVLAAEASLADVTGAHARALDAQIELLRLRRAVLRAVARSTDTKELELMSDLATLTRDERRRVLEDYLDAVFGEEPSPLADRLRQGAPELPEDPTPEQLGAWIELAELLRDPEYVRVSRGMAERARTEEPPSEAAHHATAAVTEHAGAAARAGVDPASAEALRVIELIEAATPGGDSDRSALAERIAAFTDRRVLRYWKLVGTVNGWPVPRLRSIADAGEGWEWYSQALRAHAGR